MSVAAAVTPVLYTSLDSYSILSVLL